MNHDIRGCGRFACTAARVFDGERTLAEHAVLVENGVVSAVIPQRSLPEGVPLWHEPDSTILPGLIDTHVHFMRWQGPLFLAYGVTTIRDVGNDLEWILARRREWAENLWPRILCVGPLLDGEKLCHTIVSRRCADAADAVTAVRETAAAGVDGIKLYVGLKPEWLTAMAREAHAAGCRVSMHCSGGGVLAAGRAGIDEFFHLDGILEDIWPTHPAGWLNVWGMPELSHTWDRQREAADAIRDLGMTATPTLAYWDSQWRIRTADHLCSEEMRHVPPVIVELQGRQPADPVVSAQWRRALHAAERFVGLLLERGVPLLAGSDVPCGAVPPGLSLWRELSLLVEAGLSPTQALRAATSAAATFMGQSQLGRLRPGSTADMVVVRGNPMEQIPETPDIAMVIRHGTAYRPVDLLAAAETAASTLKEEPWGIQLALHRAGIVTSGTS
jgi:imidazolonepropionase-like amidohydrolase